jgi:carbon monoxide dehydrogenase subunit G
MNQQRRFTTQINIAAPPERVLQFLGDLINLKHLHPLIQNVQRVDAPEGCVRAYKITDLIDFGLFSR